MGTDLRLLPVDALHQNSGAVPWGFSHTVLNLPRRSEAWKAILGLPAERIPLPHNVSSYVGAHVPDGRAKGETMYGTLEAKDAYGDPYAWIRAGTLKPVLREFFRGEPTTAYVEAMRDDALIILDWH